MGFDLHEDKPLVEPRKKATRVNFWIAGAIVVFLAIGWIYFGHTAAHPAQTQNQVQQNLPAEGH